MRLDEHYTLRPLQIEDAEALFQIIDGERTQMREWLPFVDNTHRMEDTRDAILSFATPENPQFCIVCQEEVVGLLASKRVTIIVAKRK